MSLRLTEAEWIWKDGDPTPTREAVLAALFVALAYLLLRTSPAFAAGAFNDDGVYLALGKALAEGEGYRSIYAVGDPVHAKYPPLLPLLYAGLWSLSSDLFTVHRMALALSLMTIAAAAGITWWFARSVLRLSRPTSLFFVLGPFLLEGSVQYFNLAISEPLFMLVWALVLVLFARLDQPEDEHRGASDAALGLAIGLTVAAATLARSQGIVLIPAVFLAMLLRRTSSKAVATFSLGALVPVSAWRLWHGSALSAGPLGTQPDEGAYVSWTPSGGLAELTGWLAELTRTQVMMYGTFLPPHLSGATVVGGGLWLIVLAVATAGALMAWRSRPVLVLSCLGAGAVIFLWPWAQDRFVLSMFPFLGMLAGLAIDRWRRARGAAWNRGLAIVAVVVVAVVGFRQVEIRRLPITEGGGDFLFHPAQFLPENTLYIVAASRWLEANTDMEESVLAPHPVGIWLYTGRKTVNSTPALPDIGPTVWDVPGRFIARRLADDRPTYVVLSNLNYLIAREVSVVQRACPEGLEYPGFTEGVRRVAFYRVDYGDPCLEQQFWGPASEDLRREKAERA